MKHFKAKLSTDNASMELKGHAPDLLQFVQHLVINQGFKPESITEVKEIKGK